MLPLLFGVQSFVTPLDQVFEEPVEDTLGQGTDGIGSLSQVPTLGYEFVTYFDPGLQQVLVQIVTVQAQQYGDLLTFLRGCTIK